MLRSKVIIKALLGLVEQFAIFKPFPAHPSDRCYIMAYKVMT